MLSEMFTGVHSFSLTRATSAAIDSKSTEACREMWPAWRGGGHCWVGQLFVRAASLRLCLPGPKQVVVVSHIDQGVWVIVPPQNIKEGEAG